MLKFGYKAIEEAKVLNFLVDIELKTLQQTDHFYKKFYFSNKSGRDKTILNKSAL